MITIADVALRAGVSKTTVSHTLSGKRPVSEETRKKVEQSIQDLGFRPNILAQSLRMQRSQTVALIIPDITNPFYPVLARGLQNVLVEQGYHTFLCNTDGQLKQEQAIIPSRLAWRFRVVGTPIAMVPPPVQPLEHYTERKVCRANGSIPCMILFAVLSVATTIPISQILPSVPCRSHWRISRLAGRSKGESRSYCPLHFARERDGLPVIRI